MFGQHVTRITVRQPGGVERNPGAAHLRVGAACESQSQLDRFLDGRCRVILEAENTIATQRVAHYHHVRLAAEQQAERYGSIGRVEYRALALDDVPMVGVRIRTQYLRGARDEIGDHRVYRNAAAGDHDSGLTGGTKVHRHGTLSEGPGQGERGVFLADCTVGPDREQALAAAPAP